MWKDIPNLQYYQVNELGEVRTLNYEHKGITRILKQSKTEKGYLKVNINGKAVCKKCIETGVFGPNEGYKYNRYNYTYKSNFSGKKLCNRCFWN